MKKLTTLIILIAITLIFTSCQSNLDLGELENAQSGSFAGAATADYDILDKGPSAGGVLNLYMTSPDTLDPILTKNPYVSGFLSLIYEGLTRLDENGKPEPVLSDSWEVSADGLIWDFHMHSGIKWQDGQPFTAEDAAFTIRMLMNAATDSVYKPLIRNVSSCEALDSEDMRLVLTKPDSFLPAQMTFPILPKHLFTVGGAAEAVKIQEPVGTGPYRYLSADEDGTVHLTADRNWWNLSASGADPQSGFYLSTINIRVVSSMYEAMGLMQTGEIDMLGIEVNEFSKFTSRSDLNIKKYLSRNYEFIAMNEKSLVLGDRYVRKAIDLAIDKDALIRDVLSGLAVRAEFPVHPDNWIEDSKTDKPVEEVWERLMQLANQNHNESESTPAAVSAGFSEAAATSAAILADTPEEALKEGGWKESSQGYYKTVGGIRQTLSVELLVNSNNSLRIKAAQQICSQLITAGIPAMCVQADWTEVLKRMREGHYSMVLTGCQIPQIPDISYLYSNNYLATGNKSIGDAAFNISGYENPLVDAGITELFRETDQDKQMMYYQAIKEWIRHDTPYIGLYFTKNAIVYSRLVRGPIQPTVWDSFAGIGQWYKLEQP